MRWWFVNKGGNYLRISIDRIVLLITKPKKLTVVFTTINSSAKANKSLNQ